MPCSEYDWYRFSGQKQRLNIMGQFYGNVVLKIFSENWDTKYIDSKCQSITKSVKRQ